MLICPKLFAPQSATRTLSLNDQSAPLEVKREGGRTGSVNHPQKIISSLVAWRKEVHKGNTASFLQHRVEAVCEWMIIFKEEQ